jgi:UDP-3-O-acyl-N-acetylglucosamine deacetylase
MSGATIGTAVSLTGVDWQGRAGAGVRLSPAGPGTGIWFNGSVPAAVAHADVTRHATCLGRGEARVHMVEHLLAACSGLGVTDLAVRTRGPGLPIGDGSAEPYVRLLKKAGLVRYKPGPARARLPHPVLVQEGSRFIAAIPARGLTVSCVTSFPGIGPQSWSFSLTPASFVRDVARARTLVLSDAAPALVREKFRMKFRLKQYGRFVCAEQWRFRDEPCRHKVLDLLGDMALLGRPLEAAVFAYLPGHRLNHAFVRGVERELEV